VTPHGGPRIVHESRAVIAALTEASGASATSWTTRCNGSTMST
jgi:hypothetical protein